MAPVSGSFAGPTQNATFVLGCDDPATAEKTLQLTRTEKGKDHSDTKSQHKDDKDDKDDGEIIKDHGPPEVLLAASPEGHFIGSELRPDLSGSALRDEEPGAGEGQGGG